MSIPLTTQSHRLLSSVFVAASVLLPATAPGQIIFERTKLLAADGADGDWFGRSLVAGDGLVVIGAPFHTVDGAANAGSVYLFEIETGTQRLELSPTPLVNGRFGYAVDIDDGLVAVGNIGGAGDPVRYGAVFVYDARTGVLKDTFDSIHPHATFFGGAVAMDAGLLAVGAHGDDANGEDTGTVYVFDVDTGDLLTQLFSSVPTPGGMFGECVAIDDGLIAVGAWRELVGATNSGAVHVFDARTGELISRITPDEPEPPINFGRAVAIENGIVAVGSNHPRKEGPDSASVYLFDARTGSRIARVFPDGGTYAGVFSHAISMDRGIVAVGAAGERTSGHRGAGTVYLFEAVTGRRIGKLLASDAALYDRLGYRVAMSRGKVVASAPTDRIGETWNGSAYVFDLNCRADLDENGMLDITDLEDFFIFHILDNPRADFAFDGVFDFFDIQAYLNLYAAGCP